MPIVQQDAQDAGAIRPTRVAIIGSGAASITAAFELTRPEHNGTYQVTVYQSGWRLGGKGASGRGPSGRIEEHGLHLWFGCYENAFRLLRECYAELGRDKRNSPFPDWRDAFLPAPWVGNMDLSRRGEWLSRMAQFVPADGLPGDSLETDSPFTVARYLARTVALIRTMAFGVETLGPGSRPLRSARPGLHAAEPATVSTSLDAVIGNMLDILRHGMMTSTAVVVQWLGLLEVALRSLPQHGPFGLLRPLEDTALSLRAALTRLAFDETDRFKAELIDVMCAILVGVLRFGLLTDPRGFDAIDEYELRAWLRLNGAAEASVRSALVQGLYDLPLAYEGGDADRAALAAGQGLRGFFRMFFGHRGPFAWKMRAGMGDVVFAPLYEVLTRRGVTFEFFHRLENVRIAGPDGGRYVAGLDFSVQAETRDGDPYRPLVDVKGLPCWPSKPDFGQLKDGAALLAEGREFESAWDHRSVGTKHLQVTTDFDFVVLGVSIGEIPRVCREILAVDGRWRAMVQHVKTVATQAFQVWLRTDLQGTGWVGPPPTVSAFVKPFDTWADMSQVIPHEDWTQIPDLAAYFCSVLADPPSGVDMASPEYTGKRRAEVRDNAIHFLNTHVRHIWPKAVDEAGEFRWDLLADADTPDGSPADTRRGVSRFETQFWVANVNPTDRYVLSVPGSNKYRISPLDRTYDNLTIAGDWTDCGFNLGCVEAAVMSGRLAAHALSLSPSLDEIVGYHHP